MGGHFVVLLENDGLKEHGDQHLVIGRVQTARKVRPRQVPTLGRLMKYTKLSENVKEEMKAYSRSKGGTVPKGVNGLLVTLLGTYTTVPTDRIPVFPRNVQNTKC